MLATFNDLEAGTGLHDFAPTGPSGTNTGLSNEAVAPETFTATGLRVTLGNSLPQGSREFIFDNDDDETPLRCEIEAGEQACQSNARVTVPAGSVIWFRVRNTGTLAGGHARVGWRAVLP